MNLSKIRRERPPLSAEERELLSTPNVDLEARVRKRSFNYEKFCEQTDTLDRGQFVLQAHLYFDHVITLLLSEALARPEKINVKRMGFSQKLAFVLAMGLASEDLVRLISLINEMRNKFAHDLDYTVSDRVQADFKNSVSERIKSIIAKSESDAKDENFELSSLRFTFDRNLMLKKEHSALRATLLGDNSAVIAD